MNMVKGVDGEIIERLRSASSVAVLTGAGVSAESGVPTFRGDEGLWNNFRAEELATPSAFERDPGLVWRWYDWRRTLLAPLKPNPGHEVLARFGERFDDMTLITQNVDGLHRSAGSNNVIEMHGNIWQMRCTDEGTVTENLDTPLRELPPRCPDCEALMRPHIVWFGESLAPDILSRAFEAAKRCDLFFVIGTSGAVQPAASLAGIAKAEGAFVIEINIEKTPLSGEVDATMLGPSARELLKLEKML